MNQDTIITLLVSQSGNPPQYLLDIKVNGIVLVSNLALSAEDTRAVQNISRQYLSLFESHAARLPTAQQAALGRELFQIWLGPHWDKIKKNMIPGRRRILVVASPVPEVLNLPWEMVMTPEGKYLGLDPLFSVRRLPRADELPAYSGELRARPLRLLFMACAPTDQANLDHEREEEKLLEAISAKDLAFDSGDLGTFEELCERVQSFQPHVVHISGHGVVENGEGKLCFEDDAGHTDLKSSEEISMNLAGYGVQCIFVSGCQSGQSPPFEVLGGICQGLVNNEVPLAIGWAASIADDLATQFAQTFYSSLVNNQPIDRALTAARQKAWEICKNQGDLSWTLPMLYASTTRSLVVDPDLERAAEEAPRSTIVQQPLAGMKEGYAEHFLGRRRELQRLIPGLRDGKKLQVLILSGLGGSGKSALATRIARKLETEKFVVIPIPSSQNDPLNAGRLIESCIEAFRQSADKHQAKGEEVKARELEAACHRLEDDKLPANTRLRQIVSTLNGFKFLMVLDNFESNLNEQDLKIMDADLAEFYPYLLNNLSGGSRAIITTRYLPSDVPSLPPGVLEEHLGDIKEAAFINFLRRDDTVDRRYRTGELPLSLLQDLYKKFGGTPRFLLQMREALRQMGLDELKSELEKVELPLDAEAGRLQELRSSYFETIITSRLYEYLQPEARKALSRAAVYGIAINLDGLVAVCGERRDNLSGFIKSWQKRAFVYPEIDTAGSERWVVYGLIRSWLTDKLSSDERKQAHKDAGDFLSELEKKDHGQSLGLNWVAILQEARAQYLQADEYEMARDATNRLSEFFQRSGLYEGLRQINREMMDFDPNPTAMHWIGRSYEAQGDFDTAKEKYQRELDASADKSLDAALAYHSLATIDLQQGNYQAAYETFMKALQIRQDIGHRSGEAATLHNLASIDLKQGNYQAAYEKFMKALQILQEIGDRAGEAATLHNLASIDLNQGNYQAAHETFMKALQIRQEIGDRAGEAHTLHQLAYIDQNQGNYQAAHEKYMKSLQIQQEIGDRAGEAHAWHNLASIDLDQGNYQAAHETFMKALQIRQEIGDRAGEAITLHQLGILAIQLGSKEEGARLIALCCQLLNSIGHADFNRAFPGLQAIASELNYSQEQFDAMLREVVESYNEDGGKALIAAAFKQ